MVRVWRSYSVALGLVQLTSSALLKRTYEYGVNTACHIGLCTASCAPLPVFGCGLKLASPVVFLLFFFSLLLPSTDLVLSHQLDELGSHLSSLVQLLKVGLEDARDAFSSEGRSQVFSAEDNVDESMTNHGRHLLEVHAEAIRLDSRVNTDFVRFIQAFLDR